MNQEIISTLITMVLLPLLAALFVIFGEWMRKKTKQLTESIDNATISKYVNFALEAVALAVYTTFQTYVDSLKAQGKFNTEAQSKALRIAKTKASNLITEEARKAIIEAYGDFDEWLETAIETLVREDHKTPPTTTLITDIDPEIKPSEVGTE